MIEALIAGQTDPDELASLAHRRLKVPRETLREALRGRVTLHHRFLLRLHLQQIDMFDAAIAEIEAEVDANVAPFRTAIRVLTIMPCISELAARSIVAEIGTDMTRFPTASGFISWAGLCPRNDESAGKRRSNRLSKGAPWLKTTLIQCAWSGVRKKASYFQAQFQRIRARRGAKKAIGAVATAMLTAIWHMLTNGTLYQDLGGDYFDQRAKATQTKHLVGRLQQLGYDVTIAPQEG
jgi:transposase